MLEGRTYVPLLHARLAEMRALRELPTPTKNLVFPVIKIRPWLNSKHLEKAFSVIEDAFGDRAYGLDLDITRCDPNNEKIAYREFAALFDPQGGFSAYYKCVESIPNCIPVLRNEGGIVPALADQLDQIEQLDRGAVIRFDLGQMGNYLACAQDVRERGFENIVFVVDCGWRIDVLDQSANCVGIVNNILDVSENFEIVVAGSSFPNVFSGMGDRASFAIGERALFQNVRQAINRGELYYGDWGSTRPPAKPVPMTNVPRIDIARRESWTAWRSEDGETYGDVAERVVADPLWDGDLDLWGDYMIASTAQGLDPAIRAPTMAAAVRVNLHMDTQARYDQTGAIVIGDEPIGEDF